MSQLGPLSLLPSQAAAANLVADGAYAVQVPVPPQLPTGVPSSVIAIVGAARKGKPHVPIGPISVSSQTGIGPILAALGDGIVNGSHIAYDIVREAVSATPEGSQFVFVRETDGTETAATLKVPDGTGFATDALTVGGTWVTAKALQATITPASGPAVVINYTSGTNGDTTNATTAQQIANQINLSPAVTGPTAFLQPIPAAAIVGGVIPLTALASGAGGNTIGLTTNVPTGMTFTAGSATFTGGAAPGVLATITFSEPGTLANGATGVLSLQSGTLAASPVLAYTLAFPYNGQQTWRNIIAYATPGGGFDAPTFKTNFLAAFNGTAPNQVASPLGVASSGSSTANPLLGVVQTASGGTDGLAGITTNSLLGVDGGSRSGMYALRGVPFGVLVLAGCSDPAADVVMQGFLDTVGGVGVTEFPSSTSLAAAQTAKTSYALNNRRIVRMMDWLSAPDTLAGQSSAIVSVSGAAAGVGASLQPWQSWANKPDGVKKGNAFGTEKTINNQPVDPQNEGSARKLLGFNYFTAGQPRTNGLLGLAHGKTSDGSNIADVRMADYLAARGLAILQKYVGKRQLPPPAPGTLDIDPVRKQIRDDFAALKAELTVPNDPRVAAFAVQFVGTAPQVAAGYCPWQLQAQTLAGIEFALLLESVGTTVQVAA